MSRKKRLWFTSDTHYGHAGIIKICNRPFKNVDSMNNWLVEIINQHVGPKDTLWHLGDFALGHKSNSFEFISRINCNDVRIVLGNNDGHFKDKELHNMFSRVVGCHKGQEIVGNCLDTHIFGHRFILSHYPYRIWNRSYDCSINLYGHSHASLPDAKNKLCIDVGIDAHERPISIEEILHIMKKKKERSSIEYRGDLPVGSEEFHAECMRIMQENRSYYKELLEDYA